MQKVPQHDAGSHDPMKWTEAENALREINQTEAADICHRVAGELARSANVTDSVVIDIKTPQPSLPKK